MRVNHPSTNLTTAAMQPAKKPVPKPEALLTTTAALPNRGSIETLKPLKLEMASISCESPEPLHFTGDSLEMKKDAPTAQNTSRLTLDGLMSAWGQVGSQYDLNGSGLVDVNDLLQFISGMPGSVVAVGGAPTEGTAGARPTIASSETAPAPSVSSPPSETVPSEPMLDETQAAAATAGSDEFGRPAPGARPSLAGLIDAWGQGDATYDLTGDGTVNVDDLLAFIGQMGGNPAAPAPAANGARGHDGARPSQAARGTQGLGQLNKLARTLVERLEREGFDSQPPVNVRELVASLDLSPKQDAFMMKKLAARYPQGLGVSLRA